MTHILPETIIKAFSFNNHEISINRVKDLDKLVDQIDDTLFSEDERLPYWAELWPSAIGLSRYIAANKKIVEKKAVLELGCGLGLTSLLLSVSNPSSLLITDYEQDALDFLARNFKLNNFPVPKLKILDWRTPALNQKFDVIITSDVLYEKRFFSPLVELLDNYLLPEGVVYLAEPNRPIAEPFFDLLKERNFTFDKVIENVLQDGQNIRVNIYQIRSAVPGHTDGIIQSAPKLHSK